MLRNHAFLFLLLTLFLSLTEAAPTASKPTQLSEPQLHEMNRLASLATLEYGIVGQSIAVLRNGQLVWSYNSGLVSADGNAPVSSDTIFPIYSVTKLFVAAVVTKLVQEDKLDVNKPVGEYLENLPNHWRQLKVRDLLAHASGLPEYFSIDSRISDDPQQIIASLQGQPFDFETGSQVRYNQTGFLLLKLIIEKAFAAPWEDIVKAEITEPVGLPNALFGGSERDIEGRVPHHYFREQGELKDSGVPVFATTTYASTGLNASAGDLAKWFGYLFSGQYIPQKALWDSWKPYPLKNGNTGEYDHGWQIQREDDVTAVGHYGGNIINVRHFFVNANKKQSVTVIHLNSGGQTAEFSSFDFAYQLAQAADPEIVMETLELKKSLHELAKNNDFESLQTVYWHFKSKRKNRARNTEIVMNELGWQLLDADPVMARDIFQLNLEDYPESAIAHDSYAEGLYRTGHYQTAKYYFEKALKMNPSFSHIAELVAEIESRLATKTSID